MKNIYESGEYAKTNPSFHERDSGWKSSKVIKIMERNNLQPRNIIEVGCGAGEILRILQMSLEEDIELIGYDVSPQAHEIAIKKSNDKLNFFLGDVNNFVHKSKYDILLMIDVFEHVEDYINFIRGTKHLAKKHIFHIPLDISVQKVLRNKHHALRESVGHIHYFTKDTALLTLEQAGYQIIDYMYTAGAYELPNRNFMQKLLSIPRKVFYKINRDICVRVLGGYSLMVLAK
tara:strand:- start:633 stop:1328 length:696 start_codon:yes stop_codon:yes gene_type:complete